MAKMSNTARTLKIVPALIARTQLGQILRRVRQNHERFVVDKRGEPQAVILGLAIAAYFRWFVSGALLGEYEGVLRRERFGLSPRSVTQSMRTIRKCSTLVIPKRKLNVSRDPDDNKVVECALEARADY